VNRKLERLVHRTCLNADNLSNSRYCICTATLAATF